MEVHHSLGTSTDWIVMVVYFIAIMAFGAYFSKYNRTTTDFFFGGRRFAWWLIAMSIVATGVGSHSFIKYSAKGFTDGFASTMTYMNDWFFVPFFIFGWLPIIVYTRIRSIPEYFERRFSPGTRFLATILILLYMIGYVGIGFLTMGKAILPLLPQDFTILGIHFQSTLMGLVVVIALIVGIYITYGGQTAVIFTDLAQGFVLIFAGALVFFLGIDYLGGFGIFWNLLPTTWKLPLADFNSPPGFNFVGIFWQDGIAGSVGFLFMNMGLVMRFMATKSVDEGRKAAAFNILFMLPLSAIVVGNAGWIAKAISVTSPDVIPPNTNPDAVFVVVANIISHPGVFGFIMAALTAALMSTVDTLLNATAAVYINDIHRPAKKWLSKKIQTVKEKDKQELSAARIATALFTILGVLAVIPFSAFPTVYEAHGFFHSTLTPPLVVAIFLGVFWKKFTNASVIATFVVGVALMVLGMYYPKPLIQIFAHGTEYDAKHPYTYIGALYNLFVCVFVGVITTLTRNQQKKIVEKIKTNPNHKSFMPGITFVSGAIFMLIALNVASLPVLLVLTAIMLVIVVISSNYYSKYSEETHTEGLTVWGIAKAKETFKGSKVNERDGETIKVKWVLKDYEDDVMKFSKNDMLKMAAEPGDLVYISDARKILGGLKSCHSTFGESHDEDGIVYITQEHVDQGQFVKGKFLTAEMEM
ncbi:MAG TPA: sodium:solute symporter family protein [Ignavibacteriaceae bacterium]|nr:sodium:solute symporter family protein [Ignavibacteriaceae bacterium]HRQ55420.1 sodium:solute symporter family protein [Ignavibacteriaceae bacterium]